MADSPLPNYIGFDWVGMLVEWKFLAGAIACNTRSQGINSLSDS
ncbi:hypothetical protein NWP17_14680 [Chrysosporum bergii ANA360D]|uniref:Uncharacterized protein n=1 Tax=Chrysosporum bergii ANA360D TaxID=617107 RepID=A0AA43KCP1_9CYAN|nr:hypothetical protein [Chrysosporum bergii]MDH6061662.1 hypothetical protein [Chrysosporum bergii ANA360D]